MTSLYKEGKTHYISKAEIVNILMDSPFYFSLLPDERKEIINRIEAIVKGG